MTKLCGVMAIQFEDGMLIVRFFYKIIFNYCAAEVCTISQEHAQIVQKSQGSGGGQNMGCGL